jgi:pilus assembly protein Flp/PilA
VLLLTVNKLRLLMHRYSAGVWMSNSAERHHMNGMQHGFTGSPPAALGGIMIKRFLRDESGATAIEYGLIAAGISVAIIAVVNSLGGQLKTTFSSISSQLGNAGK